MTSFEGPPPHRFDFDLDLDLDLGSAFLAGFVFFNTRYPDC